MSWRSRLIIALVVALPTPLLAQTAASKKLVGTWGTYYELYRQRTRTSTDTTRVADTLVFKSNGVLRRALWENGLLSGTAVDSFQWSYSHDTLRTQYANEIKPVLTTVEFLENGQK